MKRKKLLRIGSFFFALIFLCMSLVSCASNLGKPLMTLDKNGIKVTLSVNIYELMLTRMKGALVNGGLTIGGMTAKSEAFWNYTSKFDSDTEMTLDEHYRKSIQENCRTYLAALYLFEEMGLALSAADIADVDDRLNELLLTDGNGSKTKLNSVLSEFGVNYDILREAYLLEKKVSAVQIALFGENASLIGDDIKTDFMEDNYVHFRQIFLPSYHFVCETDENGDDIYFYSEGVNEGHIYYDVHNGVVGYNEDGSKITDQNGDVVYYVNDEQYKTIAYDQINGKRSYLMDKDDPNKYQTKAMEDGELDELKARANSLFERVQGADYSDFEKIITLEADKSSPTNDMADHPDGYYLDRNVDYAAMGVENQYLSDIVTKLDTMQDGQVALISSSIGYHIIMKYPYTAGAYSSEVNTVWFENFNSQLIQQKLLERCQSLYPDIKLDEAVLASAPNMKEVAINYFMI